MTAISSWTGREASALRQALRLSVRAFAEHLDVAPRTVSKWAKLGEATREDGPARPGATLPGPQALARS